MDMPGCCVCRSRDLDSDEAGAVPCCLPRRPGQPAQPLDPNVERDVIAMRKSIGLLQGVVQDLQEDVTQIRQARSRSASIMRPGPEGCGIIHIHPGLTLGGEPLSPRTASDIYSPELSARYSAKSSARSWTGEGPPAKTWGGSHASPRPFGEGMQPPRTWGQSQACFEMTPTRGSPGPRRMSAPSSEASTAADSSGGNTALLFSLSPRGDDPFGGASPRDHVVWSRCA